MVTPAFAAYFDIETPIDLNTLKELTTPSSEKYQKRTNGPTKTKPKQRFWKRLPMKIGRGRIIISIT